MEQNSSVTNLIMIIFKGLDVELETNAIAEEGHKTHYRDSKHIADNDIEIIAQG